MSEFEYTTFVLGRCLTPAAKYAKVNNDINEEKSKPFWRRNKLKIAMLNPCLPIQTFKTCGK